MVQARVGSEKSQERQPPGRSGQAGVETGAARAEHGSQMERGSQAERGSERGNGRQGGPEGSSDGRKQRNEAINMTVSALRSLGQFYDMQAATARIMMRAQSRAASAFGLPDYSRLFEIGDDRASHLFSAATENLVQFVGQEGEVLNEVPSQVFRLFEQQAIDATERWKYGLQEFRQQTTQSLEELKELSRQQADEIARATEMLSEATTASLRESGEQFRSASRQGREAMSRQGEEMEKGMREGGEETGESREAGQEGSESSSRRRAA
ncbi:MAG TPA: hypothetical protein VF096_03760 [Azonexus sp.]